MTDKELEKYFNEHNYHPKPYQLELAILRYRHFGGDILDVYKNNLSNIYCRTHTWFLLEMVSVLARTSSHINYIFECLLDDNSVDWATIYGYYDEVGHGEFGSLRQLLNEHRDELLSKHYDIV